MMEEEKPPKEKIPSDFELDRWLEEVVAKREKKKFDAKFKGE